MEISTDKQIKMVKQVKMVKYYVSKYVMLFGQPQTVTSLFFQSSLPYALILKRGKICFTFSMEEYK